MDLTTSMTMEIRATAVKAVALQDAPPKAVMLAQFIDSLATGTGINSANQIYTLEGGIAAAGRTNVDLTASAVFNDVFGDQFTATTVKAIFVHNTSTTGAVINVGGGTDGVGTNAWDSWVRSAAGGGTGDGSEAIILPQNAAVLLWNPTATGWAITGDNLSFEETATQIATFSLIVICEV